MKKTAENKTVTIFTDISIGKTKTCHFHIFFYNFAISIKKL